MFIDAEDTSKLVEQALPLLPFLEDMEDGESYGLLVKWKEEGRTFGSSKTPTPPEKWNARLSVPLFEDAVKIGHEQVYTALRTVAFHDRATSPWGPATAELQQWVLAPGDSGITPSDTAAAAVLLAALYGDRGSFFMPETITRPA